MVTPSGLLVLDNDELTLRCRSCDWASPTCTTVDDAEQAFDAHACTPWPRDPDGWNVRGCSADWVVPRS